MGDVQSKNSQNYCSVTKVLADFNQLCKTLTKHLCSIVKDCPIITLNGKKSQRLCAMPLKDNPLTECSFQVHFLLAWSPSWLPQLPVQGSLAGCRAANWCHREKWKCKGHRIALLGFRELHQNEVSNWLKVSDLLRSKKARSAEPWSEQGMVTILWIKFYLIFTYGASVLSPEAHPCSGSNWQKPSPQALLASQS